MLPDGLDQLLTDESTIYSYTNSSKYKKFVMKLKMFAIVSLANITDLQIHIFIFSILVSVFKEHSMDLFLPNI